MSHTQYRPCSTI